MCEYCLLIGDLFLILLDQSFVFVFIFYFIFYGGYSVYCR